MALIDPTTPAGQMPLGDSTGNYTLTFSDEFNTSTLDAKWIDHADWYNPGASSLTNYDTNNAGNSCLRIWPPTEVALGGYNSHGYLSSPDRIITSRNSFRQTGGYFEFKFKACVGQGQWPALWLYHESIHNEMDMWEPIVPGTYASTGWGFTRADGQLSPGNFGCNIWVTDGNAARAAKYSDLGGAAPMDYAARFFYIGQRWDAAAGSVQSYLYWFDDANVRQGGAFGPPVSWTFQNPLFLLMNLAFGNSGGTVLSSLVKGSANSMLIDYVRVWQLGGGGGGGPPPVFNASLVSAPANGATINGTVHFTISGTGIQNAELLPADPTAYLPNFGTFTLGGGGTTGNLDWDTTTRPNGEIISVRISAFNVPAGSAGSEIIVMTRTYTINNNPAISTSAAPSPTFFCANFP